MAQCGPVMFEEEHGPAYVMICQSPHKVCAVYLMGSLFRSVLDLWNVAVSGVKYSSSTSVVLATASALAEHRI